MYSPIRQSHTKYGFLVLFIFTVVYFIPSYAYCKHTSTNSSEYVKGRLERVKKNIELKKESILLSRQKASTILSELDNLDKTITNINTQINDITTQKAQLSDKLADTKTRITSLNNSIAIKRAVIDKRLVTIFKLKQSGYLSVLLAADSVSDMEKRYTLMNCIIRQDEKEVNTYLSELDSLAEAKKTYTDQSLQLGKLKDNLSKHKDRLLQTHNDKAHLLALINHNTAIEKRILRELEKSADTLKKALKSLEPSSGSISGFAAMKGRLPLPVNGKILQSFRDRLLNEMAIKGILFKVTKDSNIKVVYPGKIVWAEWLRGYGNTIIVDHGDRYFTIYSHVDKIDMKVGESVKAGDVIGNVGDTGLSSGKTLYFEIRHGENTLNPLKWLKIR